MRRAISVTVQAGRSDTPPPYIERILSCRVPTGPNILHSPSPRMAPTVCLKAPDTIPGFARLAPTVCLKGMGPLAPTLCLKGLVTVPVSGPMWRRVRPEVITSRVERSELCWIPVSNPARVVRVRVGWNGRALLGCVLLCSSYRGWPQASFEPGPTTLPLSISLSLSLSLSSYDRRYLAPTLFHSEP